MMHGPTKFKFLQHVCARCVVHGTTITLPVMMLCESNLSFGIQNRSITEGLCGKGSSKMSWFIEIFAEGATTWLAKSVFNSRSDGDKNS